MQTVRTTNIPESVETIVGHGKAKIAKRIISKTTC